MKVRARRTNKEERRKLVATATAWRMQANAAIQSGAGNFIDEYRRFASSNFTSVSSSQQEYQQEKATLRRTIPGPVIDTSDVVVNQGFNVKESSSPDNGIRLSLICIRFRKLVAKCLAAPLYCLLDGVGSGDAGFPCTINHLARPIEQFNETLLSTSFQNDRVRLRIPICNGWIRVMILFNSRDFSAMMGGQSDACFAPDIIFEDDCLLDLSLNYASMTANDTDNKYLVDDGSADLLGVFTDEVTNDHICGNLDFHGDALVKNLLAWDAASDDSLAKILSSVKKLVSSYYANDFFRDRLILNQIYQGDMAMREWIDVVRYELDDTSKVECREVLLIDNADTEAGSQPDSVQIQVQVDVCEAMHDLDEIVKRAMNSCASTSIFGKIVPTENSGYSTMRLLACFDIHDSKTLNKQGIKLVLKMTDIARRVLPSVLLFPRIVLPDRLDSQTSSNRSTAFLRPYMQTILNTIKRLSSSVLDQINKRQQFLALYSDIIDSNHVRYIDSFGLRGCYQLEWEVISDATVNLVINLTENFPNKRPLITILYSSLAEEEGNGRSESESQNNIECQRSMYASPENYSDPIISVTDFSDFPWDSSWSPEDMVHRMHAAAMGKLMDMLEDHEKERRQKSVDQLRETVDDANATIACPDIQDDPTTPEEFVGLEGDIDDFGLPAPLLASSLPEVSQLTLSEGSKASQEVEAHAHIQGEEEDEVSEL